MTDSDVEREQRPGDRALGTALRRAPGRLVRDARAYLEQVCREDLPLARALCVFALLQLLVSLWDLPSAYGWENDGIAPRDLFGGLAINLTPGEGHRYPLFHYVLVAALALPALLLAVLPLLVTGNASGTLLAERVLQADVMTAVSLAAKLLSIAMGCVTLLVLARIVRRSASPDHEPQREPEGASPPGHAGRWAALFAATSTSVAYYTRSSNLDGPALMWTVLALDRGICLWRGGTTRDYAVFGALVAAAVATKDPSYGAFALTLPAYGAALLWRPGGARGLWVSALSAAGSYALLSGALFNPTGFVTRLGLLTGSNSEDWRRYERSFAGLLENARDLATHQADFTWPWPVVALALFGVALALYERPGRAERLLLLVAGLSSLLTFTLVVARCEHRFALVWSTALAAYAGYAAAALQHRPTAPLLRIAARLLLALCLLLALGRYVALGATQWLDARRDVEALLDRLPRGSRVEVYGLIVYWPRFDLSPDAPYRVTHVDRRALPMPGLSHAKPPYAPAAARGADVLVVPEEFTQRFLTAPESEARAFFLGARAGTIPGYRLALLAEPRLPALLRALGLGPIELHGSTGKRTFVFLRERASASGRGTRPNAPLLIRARPACSDGT